MQTLRCYRTPSLSGEGYSTICQLIYLRMVWKPTGVVFHWELTWSITILNTYCSPLIQLSLMIYNSTCECWFPKGHSMVFPPGILLSKVNQFHNHPSEREHLSLGCLDFNTSLCLTFSRWATDNEHTTRKLTVVDWFTYLNSWRLSLTPECHSFFLTTSVLAT